MESGDENRRFLFKLKFAIAVNLKILNWSDKFSLKITFIFKSFKIYAVNNTCN